MLQEQCGLIPGRQPELVQALRQMCVGPEQGRGTGHHSTGCCMGILAWLTWDMIPPWAGRALAGPGSPGEGTCAGLAGRDSAELGQLLSLPSFSCSSCQDSGGVWGQQKARGGSLCFCCLQLKLERDCSGQLLAVELVCEQAMSLCRCIWSLYGSQLPCQLCWIQ